MPKAKASSLDAIASLGHALPEKLRNYLEYLRVPTRPDYDWQLSPQEQGEDMVNPVELNNQITVYGNAQIELGAAMVALNRKRLDARKRKRAIERTLVEMELLVLRAAGIKSSDKNSKILQQAFIEKTLSEDAAQFALYQQLRQQLDAIVDELDEIDTEADNVDQFIKVVKHASDNAQTFLSFVKNEWNRRPAGA